jgi:hypothetical protein
MNFMASPHFNLRKVTGVVAGVTLIAISAPVSIISGVTLAAGCTGPGLPGFVAGFAGKAQVGAGQRKPGVLIVIEMPAFPSGGVVTALALLS